MSEEIQEKRKIKRNEWDNQAERIKSNTGARGVGVVRCESEAVY